MKQIKCEALVVGSGAAGFSAAYRLNQQGIKDVIIVTNGKNKGTSRNTGSDKQTYYKLNLCGLDSDSVESLANDIFKGGACDGDNALCEAASSARCYYTLLELGVPFVLNEVGEVCGYLTDHGKGQRATSAGPLTSKYMTYALEGAVTKQNTIIEDGYYGHALIVEDNTCFGLIAYDKKNDEPVAFISNNTILATGGPALVYDKSVYPTSQVGAMALAVKAGAKMQNLTEWQFGIASTKFRWNLSGSYQQALPRYFSVDEEGKEYDFLVDGFDDIIDMINSVFLKGYQWPFDARKAIEGSSRVDLLVHQEIAKNRKVYMDFLKNPWESILTTQDVFAKISKECREYLEATKALKQTPLERLLAINTKAFTLYKDNGIDLENEAMEIQIASQHMNGGISVDMNWKTSIDNLYVIGEAAGTHGVYRPGGSALNAGQVGALRASISIANNREYKCFSKQALDNAIKTFASSLKEAYYPIAESTKLMENANYIRDIALIDNSINAYDSYKKCACESDCCQTSTLAKLIAYDTNMARLTILKSIKNYINEAGSSRGSYLITAKDGLIPKGIKTNNDNKYLFNSNTFDDKIQVVQCVDGKIEFNWRKVRNIPAPERVFENLMDI